MWSTSDGRRGAYKPMDGAPAGMMAGQPMMQPYGQPYGMMPQPYGQPMMQQPYGSPMPMSPPQAGGFPTSEIERLVHQREVTRRDKQWAESDTLRQQLQDLGVRVDNKSRSWSCSDGRAGVVPSWSELDNFQPSAPTPYQMQPPMPQGPPPAYAGQMYPSVASPYGTLLQLSSPAAYCGSHRLTVSHSHYLFL